ncbi:transglycosylase SLT domain-containing protein [Oceanicella actignis]|uniref:transglycosylase SLT domain-containing protein n=1 Tax=Oceanicella actignis TaxID=1189325 RepID=UPI0012587E17|nr:transglycosylase SLT domain-containing protein [Oceanicella actignis]TYO91494.1 hypothetical protein LY05_00348 [Oceanicella actignis]
MRIIVRAMRVAALCGALAGCAADDSRPANVMDACAIYAARPHWAEALERSQARWGAPAPIQLAIIQRESNFRKDARPPMRYALGVVPVGRASSAYGFAQALDGTWDWYRRETGAHGADRDDFADSADFVGWYMARTARVNGVDMNDAYAHYLAYHEGHAGYARGRWRTKPGVLRAAAEVEALARLYEIQLRGCGAARSAAAAPAPLGAG